MSGRSDDDRGADLEWLRGVVAGDVRAALAREEPTFVFQPIVDLLDRRLIGVEALARFGSQPHRTPDVWFGAAHRAGLGVELEHAAVRGAIAASAGLPAELYVAINVSPVAVQAEGFAALFDGVRADQVVLELTEHARVDDYPELRRALDGVRALGVRVAIDDVGAGFASLRHVLSLDPDIIKLDRDITGGVESDAGRAKLVGGLIAGATAVSTLVVAEGIESEPQLLRLVELGVRGGQGYLFGRPGPLASVLTSGADAAASLPAPPESIVAADGVRPGLEGAVLLVVDDAPSHRRLVRAAFELEGVRVHEASTAAEALDAVGSLAPDVVLLDVRLPDGSGFDVLAAVGELAAPRPLVVFVTAATAVSDRVLAFDRGADDYVLKPFSVEELVARVDALLRRGRSR